MNQNRDIMITAYRNFIQLQDLRRYVVSQVMKKNSETAKATYRIMSNTHESHMNIASEMYRPRMLALNRTRLDTYLSPNSQKYP